VAGEPPRRTSSARASTPPPPPRTTSADPRIDARLADLERQLAKARAASEKARRAAREAEARLARSQSGRPSDEELGYYETDDSFGQIISDAASDLLSDVRKRDVPRRVADLIDELGSKLTGGDR
jgi:hypothetical protein